MIRHAPEGLGQPTGAYSSGTTGAASELIVCAELMRLGFHVFRCESPHAPFDLIAYRDGQFLRVEVKTVSLQKTGPTFGLPKNDEWDLLAIVSKLGEVFLFESGATYRVIHDTIRPHLGFAPVVDQGPKQPCGTPAAYCRHLDHNEPVCDPCAQAMSRYSRERRTARKARLAALVPTESPETRPAVRRDTPEPVEAT